MQISTLWLAGMMTGKLLPFLFAMHRWVHFIFLITTGDDVLKERAACTVLCSNKRAFLIGFFVISPFCFLSTDQECVRWKVLVQCWAARAMDVQAFRIIAHLCPCSSPSYADITRFVNKSKLKCHYRSPLTPGTLKEILWLILHYSILSLWGSFLVITKI